MTPLGIPLGERLPHYRHGPLPIDFGIDALRQPGSLDDLLRDVKEAPFVMRAEPALEAVELGPEGPYQWASYARRPGQRRTTTSTPDDGRLYGPPGPYQWVL